MYLNYQMFKQQFFRFWDKYGYNFNSFFFSCIILQYFNMFSFYDLVLIQLQTFRSGGCNIREKLCGDLDILYFFIILRGCYIFVAPYMKSNSYEKG